jgi:hypothetical protein
MKWAGIAATVVFYSHIVFMGIVLLAAVQLRSPGGATFDTWRLNYNAGRLLNDDLVVKVGAADKKAKEDALSKIGSEACLRFFDKKTGLPIKGLVDDETAKEITDAKQKRTPLGDLTGDVGCLVKGYNQTQVDVAYFTSLAQDEVAEVADLKKLLASNSEHYAELIKGHEDFLAFQEMGKSPYQRLFVVAPYDLLVLMLVMLMGALGGMVRLLRDYGSADNPNPTAGEYLLIPLIGAVVAIGGYVLAKCGLLLLSSAGTESSLSPFMISLVGIVSGLLAKEVIDTISGRGRKMLLGQDDAIKQQGADRNG